MIKFKQFEKPELDFKTAVKKPIPINCYQMEKPLEVAAFESLMRGQK